FVTPNRTLVLVVYNDSPTDKTFQVFWRQRTFRYTLPALAGATFTWTRIPAVRSEGREGTTGAKSGQARLPRYAIAAEQQIQASSYTQIANLQSEPCGDADGGFDIGHAADGSWLEYDNIDFGSGPSTVDVRWASAGSGGGLE